jgi:hypothetical protein
VVADGHRAGTVELLAPRLLRGRISRFMRPGSVNDHLLPEWRALLSHAWVIAKGDGTGVAAGAL